MTGQSKSKDAALGCLIILVAIPLVALWIGHSATQELEKFGPITRDQAHAEFQMGASFVCRTAIKHQLNDPDSADFDPRDQWVVERLEDAKVIIVVTLRAKNAFGGLVRAAFRCQVQDVGGDYMVTGLTAVDP